MQIPVEGKRERLGVYKAWTHPFSLSLPAYQRRRRGSGQRGRGASNQYRASSCFFTWDEPNRKIPVGSALRRAHTAKLTANVARCVVLAAWCGWVWRPYTPPLCGLLDKARSRLSRHCKKASCLMQRGLSDDEVTSTIKRWQQLTSHVFRENSCLLVGWVCLEFLF